MCAGCGVDCRALVRGLQAAPPGAPREALLRALAPRLADGRRGAKLLAQPTEGVCWHADHIVGVAQGGGECGVENMQVLCWACHEEKTAAEAGARAATRRRPE